MANTIAMITNKTLIYNPSTLRHFSRSFLSVVCAILCSAAAIAAPVTTTIDFSKPDILDAAAADYQSKLTLTSDPGKEVDSSKSLIGDDGLSSQDWNEFFHSRPGYFPAHASIIISFDYKILRSTPDTRFYGLVKSAANISKQNGFTDYDGSAGKIGSFSASFSTGDVADYFLILGIEKGGAESIGNIKIIARTSAPTPPFPTIARTWNAPSDTDYYVDSVGGSDTNSGLSTEAPWRTLGRVNAILFTSGDRILLKSGSSWDDALAPGGSGSAAHPIILTSYGTGPQPKINANGKYRASLYLYNSEYWNISNLDISNTDPDQPAGLTGVTVLLSGFGVGHGIHLHDLYVHNVDGSDDKDAGGGAGIKCSSDGADNTTRYDGLRIEHNHIVHTDRDGIVMTSYYKRTEWPLSTNVVIFGNLLEDIGGDGIVPIGCDGCLIDHNVLRGGRTRATDYAAGIWPWSCDNTIVQYNEVSGMVGKNDAEGYDSDYNCRNTLIQYNYSHDNDGGFLLICDDGGQSMPWNIGNSGTIVRDNLSVNDSKATFTITGPCQNVQIYNNVFYQSKDINVPIVSSGNWGGAYTNNTTFENNVFYIAGSSEFDTDGMTNLIFDHNSYWGKIGKLPNDPHAVLTNPLLKNPGSKVPAGYQPMPTSPLLGAGIAVSGAKMTDYWGNVVSPDRPINIGIWQGR